MPRHAVLLEISLEMAADSAAMQSAAGRLAKRYCAENGLAAPSDVTVQMHEPVRGADGRPLRVLVDGVEHEVPHVLSVEFEV